MPGHMPADLGQARGARGGLADQTAVEDHHDAVGELQQFVESALTSSTTAPRLRTAMISAWICAIAAKSRPKQGLAAIMMSTSPPSSRASTALHVAAGELADRRVVAARLDLVAPDRVRRPFAECGLLGPPAAAREPGRSKARNAKLSTTLMRATRAFLSGLSDRYQAPHLAPLALRLPHHGNVTFYTAITIAITIYAVYKMAIVHRGHNK
jgi:hypothetical protein